VDDDKVVEGNTVDDFTVLLLVDSVVPFGSISVPFSVFFFLLRLLSLVLTSVSESLPSPVVVDKPLVFLIPWDSSSLVFGVIADDILRLCGTWVAAVDVDDESDDPEVEEVVFEAALIFTDPVDKNVENKSVVNEAEGMLVDAVTGIVSFTWTEVLVSDVGSEGTVDITVNCCTGLTVEISVVVTGAGTVVVLLLLLAFLSVIKA
jgi:hypothetical protein